MRRGAVFMIFMLLGSTTAVTAAKKWVFKITRNKNRNIIQYAVKYDKQGCKPAGKNPLYVYWRDVEEGPNVTSSIKFYEQRAYGIKSQKVTGEKIVTRLQALPQKKIEIVFQRQNDRCLIKSYTMINSKRQVFERVYVFAKEGFVMPTVQYIDVHGRDEGGRPVKERIKPD